MADQEREFTQYRPPLSGQLIGTVVDALGQRRGYLATRHARRYLSGEPVTPEVRRHCIDVLAQQLVELGIVPRLELIDQTQLTAQEILAGVIDWHSDRWDRLGSVMYAQAAKVKDREGALRSYLRLIVIDLAVRVTSLLWLTSKAPPQSGLPHWATEGGMSQHLNELRKAAGTTREQLTESCEVSRQAVDGWLDKGARPTDLHISKIAASLAPGLNVSPQKLEESLRRDYLCQFLSDRLSDSVGRETVEVMASALMMMVDWQLRGYSEVYPVPDNVQAWAGRPADLEAEILKITRIALMGCEDPGSKPFVRWIADNEANAEWRLALEAACFDSSHYLQLQYLRQGGSDLVGPGPEQSELVAAINKTAIRQTIRFIDALYRDEPVEALDAVSKWHEIQKAALQTAPGDAVLHFNVGSMIGYHWDPDEGIKECWIASKLVPEWELPLVEIGIIYLRFGRIEEARTHLETVARTRTDVTWHLLFNLAEARRRCGDPLAALEAYEEGIALNPNHPLMIDRAAHCAFLTGNGTKGRRFVKKAHLLGSNETYAEWKAGRYRKSRNHQTN